MPSHEPLAAEPSVPEGAGTAFHYEAERHPSPVVCSFPHVGLEWPDALGRRPQVNFRKNADLAVDSLAREVGTARVRARFSRLVVDLNRDERDISRHVCPTHPDPRPRADPGDPDSFKLGSGPLHRGVVWHQAIGGVATVALPLAYGALETRLARYHRPYLTALQNLLHERRVRFGRAILLDIHSMPSSVRPDIVLSTCRRSSLRQETLDLAHNALCGVPGLDVRVDDPYGGGAITARFGRPAEGIEALQIEFNRRLYLDESRLQLRDEGSAPPRRRGRPKGPTPAEICGALYELVAALEQMVLNRSC